MPVFVQAFLFIHSTHSCCKRSLSKHTGSYISILQNYTGLLLKESLISIKSFSCNVYSGAGGATTSSFFRFMLFIPFNNRNRTIAIIVNFKMDAKNKQYFTVPHTNCSRSLTPAASKAGCSKSGVITSSTKEDTIAPKAAPIITAIASSTTFPFKANS